jgi:hypothetical protein
MVIYNEKTFSNALSYSSFLNLPLNLQLDLIPILSEHTVKNLQLILFISQKARDTKACVELTGLHYRQIEERMTDLQKGGFEISIYKSRTKDVQAKYRTMLKYTPIDIEYCPISNLDMSLIEGLEQFSRLNVPNLLDKHAQLLLKITKEIPPKHKRWLKNLFPEVCIQTISILEILTKKHHAFSYEEIAALTKLSYGVVCKIMIGLKKGLNVKTKLVPGSTSKQIYFIEY